MASKCAVSDHVMTTMARDPIGHQFYYVTTLGGCRGVFRDGLYREDAISKETQVFVSGLPLLDVPTLMNDYLDVIVCYTETTEKIFVQLQNEVERIKEFTHKLQEASAESAVLINPRRGETCIAKYKADGMWYRACVVERPNTMQVKVYFVDYGNIEIIPKSDIKKLPTEQSTIPPMAVEIKLNAISGCRFELSDIRKLLEDREAILKLEGNTGRSYLATMTIVEDGREICINDILMKRVVLPVSQAVIHALSCPPTPATFGVPQITPRTHTFDLQGTPRMTPFSIQSTATPATNERPMFNNSRPPPGPCPNCKQDGHWARDCPEQKNTAFGDRIKPRGCFNCGEDGHMSRDCPQPKKDTRPNRSCYKCHQEGHIARDCTEGENSTNAFNSTASSFNAFNSTAAATRPSQSCFKCYKDGHLARDCPQGANSTNAFNSTMNSPFNTNNSSTNAFTGFNTSTPATFPSFETKPTPQKASASAVLDWPKVEADTDDWNKPKSKTVNAAKPVHYDVTELTVGQKIKGFRSDAGTTNPSLFYIQPSDWEDKLVDDHIKEGSQQIHNPTKGQACVAQFDGDWFRGEITTVNGDKATVLFVDWGNSEEKFLTDIYDISEQRDVFVKTPKLAVPCRLNGVVPLEGSEWNAEAIALFNSKTPEDAHIICDIIGKDGNTYLVDLVINGDSFAKQLIDENKAKPTVTSETVDLRSFNVGDSMMAMRSDGERANPSLFYVQPLDWADNLSLVEEQPGTQPITTAHVGQRCIAQFEDAWFRGEITSTIDDNATVLFTDWGNSEEKSLSHIFDINEQPDAVINTPKLAIACKLNGVEPLEGNDWSEDVIALFSSKTPEASDLKYNIVGKEGDVFLVDLFIGETSFAQQLIAEGKAKSAVTSEMAQPAVDARSFDVGDSMMAMRSDGETTNPSLFYVQPLDWAEKLVDDQIKPGTKLVTNAHVGQRCIAQFDDVWFRGEITSINDKNATVLFIDWGNSEEKSLSDIFDINEQPDAVINTSKLAIACKLNGVVPLEGIEWSEDVIQLFSSKTPEGSDLKYVIVAKKGDVFLVDLFIGETSFAQQLVDDGKAKFDTGVAEDTSVVKPDEFSINNPATTKESESVDE